MEYDSLIESGVVGILCGGACYVIPKLIELYRARGEERRLDTTIIATNLQEIIDGLREELEQLRADHEECISKSAKQEGDIRVLWYELKKLRAEVSDLKKKHADDNYKTTRIFTGENEAGSRTHEKLPDGEGT